MVENSNLFPEKELNEGEIKDLIEQKDPDWATKNSSYKEANELTPRDEISDFSKARQEFLAESGGKHLNDERERLVRGWDNREASRDELEPQKDENQV